MRRKVGSRFTYKGKTYLVNKLPDNETSCCTSCAFKSIRDCSWLQDNITGECCGESRGDNTNVYFTIET